MHGALITGAGGFVGSALAIRLPAHATLSLGALDWEERIAQAPLPGATIFHLAARVHQGSSGDDEMFGRDNTLKTTRLAEAAARRGARRMVFLSSVKVYGEESPGRPFRLSDPPSPLDAYGRSKLEAERSLARVAAQGGLEVVVVRSPLVFGARAKGNMRSLLALADSGWPLPLSSIGNRRSFVPVDDLAQLLLACGELPAAQGKTYLAAHDEVFSTAQLVRVLRAALGRPQRLFPAPPALLEALASVGGRGDAARRLTRSLECDPSAAQRDLGWRALIGLEASALEMARAWRESR
jgi:nucleoside-diphosphate-sugar epimerase